MKEERKEEREREREGEQKEGRKEEKIEIVFGNNKSKYTTLYL